MATAHKGSRPQMVIHYCDQHEDVCGYLVIHSLKDGLAAGGLRIRPGLTEGELVRLAENMTRKQAAAGIEVGGAKAGLDMDPHAPYCAAVLRRFFETLRPVIENTWNCGPDLNTTMAQLEAVAKEAGLPALKIAVARRRGLDDETFLRRYALFESEVDGLSVNRLRAPMAVAAATRALFDELRVSGRRPRLAIQGAGNMGGAAAWLLRNDVSLVAWADGDKSIFAADDAGLDIAAIYPQIRSGILPGSAGNARPSHDVLTADCDVLILGAISDAFETDSVSTLRCRGIVQAANLALRPEVEKALASSGIFVIPDLIASVGGSLAVEALYKTAPTTGQDILAHVERRAGELSVRCLKEAHSHSCSPREAVNRWMAAAV